MICIESENPISLLVQRFNSRRCDNYRQEYEVKLAVGCGFYLFYER